jgi:hypothetical protein
MRDGAQHLAATQRKENQPVSEQQVSIPGSALPGEIVEEEDLEGPGPWRIRRYRVTLPPDVAEHLHAALPDSARRKAGGR